MIARKLLPSTINLHFVCQINAGLGKVWLAEGFCLFSCNATWWSIALSVELFPLSFFPTSVLQRTLKNFCEPVFDERKFPLSVLAPEHYFLLVVCCGSNYKSLVKNTKVLNDKGHFCTLLYVLTAAVPPLDYGLNYS